MSKGMTLNRAIRRAREKAEKLLVGWLEELKRWRRLFCDKNVYYLPVIDRRGEGCRNDMPTIKDLIKNMEDEEDENAH